MQRLQNLAEKLDLRPLEKRRSSATGWGLESLQGRMVELSGRKDSAVLSITASLVREVQRRGEHAVWIGSGATTFYPPDFAESVDLAQLPVVLLAEEKMIPRAADLLLRSGAFALVVLDLARRANIPLAQQTRLAGLAKRHETLLLCLTEKPRSAPSLGSLVSLRAEIKRRALGDGRFACEVEVIKDKRRGLGWKHMELYRGPAGLC